MIGRTIAHYEVTDRLGAGGMGEVYRARDTRLGRSVALKILPDVFARDPDRLMRFEREARLLATLSHTNIAAVYGVEHDGERRVLVLEMVDGEDLARRIARGPIPVDEAIAIARQVAEGVEAAHEQGVVHRDLKPANIIVDGNGRVKVLDFGLAKAVEGDTTDSKLTQSPTLLSSPTAAGVILGTAAYMSPEQARGKRVDRRADIFAFGCVLYEMLSGRIAFGGDTVSDTLAAVLRADPDWSALPSDTPPAVAKLLRRCLEKDPRLRLRDIGEARIVLEHPHSDDAAPVTATVPARRSRLAWLPWTIVGALVVALLFAMSRGGSKPGEAGPVHLAFPMPDGRPLGIRGVHPAPPAISPDGTRVVFGVSQNEGTVLYVRALNSPDPVRLEGTTGAGYPFWSPDGKQVAFFAEGFLKRVDAAGGPVVSVCPAELGKGGTWSADGTILFAPSYASGIFAVAANGGEARAITRPDTARGEVSHRFPRFIGDTHTFLYLTRAVGTRATTNAVSGNKLRMATLDGTSDREIMPCETDAIFDDGHLIFGRGDYLVAQRFNPDTGELAGETIQLASPLRTLPGATRGVFDVSRNGTLVYQRGASIAGTQLSLTDGNGRELSKLGELELHSAPVLFSPDGKHVATSIVDTRFGTGDVWIYDVESGGRTRLTTNPAVDNNPAWSPDGKTIIFSSTRNRRVEVFARSTEGADAERLIYSGSTDHYVNDVSPDGKYILTAGLLLGGGWQLGTVPLSGGGDVRKMVVALSSVNASYSPSGRWVAFDDNEGGSIETYIIAASGAGRRWQVSTNGGVSPVWRGSHVYFFSDAGIRRATVSEKDSSLVVGTEEPVCDMSDLITFDVTRDESRMLLLRDTDATTREPLSVILNWKPLLARTN